MAAARYVPPPHTGGTFTSLRHVQFRWMYASNIAFFFAICLASPALRGIDKTSADALREDAEGAGASAARPGIGAVPGASAP